MNTLLDAAAKIATRAVPATAAVAVAALSLGAYSGSAARTASSGHKPLPLAVPASSIRSMAQLGAASAQWPQVSIIARPTNRDGCQGATVTLAYNAVGTLG